MTSQFANMTLSANYFDVVLFFLSSSVTGSCQSLMSMSSLVLELWQFFYKGLIRNPEIGNTPVRILPNIWRLGPVANTEFSTNVSNEMLLNATKFQSYIIYHLWVIKGKVTVAKITRSPHIQIRVKKSRFFH